MGTAELRSAFNDIANPEGCFCSRAELTYEPHEGMEWQRLTFRGTDAAGVGFVVVSDRLRPETDIMTIARDVAAKLIAK